MISVKVEVLETNSTLPLSSMSKTEAKLYEADWVTYKVNKLVWDDINATINVRIQLNYRESVRFPTYVHGMTDANGI